MKTAAVLLPGYNEELAIAKETAKFREVPDADILVDDGNSTDRSRKPAGKNPPS